MRQSSAARDKGAGARDLRQAGAPIGMGPMYSKSIAGAAILALGLFLAPESLIEPAQSLTIPDQCGGVEPCPPLCLGAAEVARSPQDFIELAAFELSKAPDVTTLAPGNLTMPPLPDPKNVYSETRSGNFSPATAGAMSRIYVPDLWTGKVSVIDPETFTVVDSYAAIPSPQHIVPSWDLQTLWISGDISYRGGHAAVMPIDPKTGKPGKPIDVPDSYNMYFTPDGRSAIVVAEAMRRLEFRDPRTMELQGYIAVPNCAGINHADFSPDGAYAIFTCEYNDQLAKIDIAHHKLAGMLQLSPQHIPQDIRMSPDGSAFFVADMLQDGLIVIDPETFKETGFIKTGVGAHGLYPSRDGKFLYVSNRGTHNLYGVHKGEGSVSVLDFATRRVVKTWPIPEGGSPDMGNVSADGKWLWLSGRYDGVVYAFNTEDGAVKTIAVGGMPHGLTVWPQPGRYSLGHTGNMR